MKKINFLDLEEKLIDGYDLHETLAFIQKAIGDIALSISGPGVQITPGFTSPFLVALNTADLGGTVAPGIAVDENGQLVVVPATGSFTLAAGHPSLARKDLLVVRYKEVGEREVARPSDPLTTTFFYLNESFELAVIQGVPAASPSYPAKQAGDVILAGLRVPAGASLASSATIDLEAREQGYIPAARFQYDTTSFRVALTKSAQSFAQTIDSMLAMGAAYIADDGTDRDRALVVCNSGGVAGDTLTVGTLTLTLGSDPFSGPAPQSSAERLCYEVAAWLRSRSSVANVVAKAGRIALSARLPGPQGIALGTTGTTFGLSAMALSGNGTRHYATGGSVKEQLTQLDAAVFSAASPGSIKMWPSLNIEPGWAELYSGQSLLRSANPILFSIFGAQYGAADATHFNLPKWAGRFPRVYDPSGLIDVDAATRAASSATGATGTAGNKVGNTLEDTFKSHTHAAPIASFGRQSSPDGNFTSWDSTQPTGATGGNETRPKDFSIVMVIKLG